MPTDFASLLLSYAGENRLPLDEIARRTETDATESGMTSSLLTRGGVRIALSRWGIRGTASQRVPGTILPPTGGMVPLAAPSPRLRWLNETPNGISAKPSESFGGDGRSFSKHLRANWASLSSRVERAFAGRDAAQAGRFREAVGQ